MPNTKPLTGRDLGKAICAHFGLNTNQVQSDYRIKTDLNGLASINLSVSLTPDDLAGIARAAAGDEPPPATQELKIEVDATSAAAAIKAVADHISMVIRDGASALRAIAEPAPVEMIQGQSLVFEPDSRPDEIIALLKQLISKHDAPLPVSAVCPGE